MLNRGKSDLKMYNRWPSTPCVVVEIIVRAILLHLFALLEIINENKL